MKNLFFQFEEEFQYLFLCDICGIFHGSDSYHVCDAYIQTCPTCSSVSGASMFGYAPALGTFQRRYQSNVSVSIVLRSCKSFCKLLLSWMFNANLYFFWEYNQSSCLKSPVTLFVTKIVSLCLILCMLGVLFVSNLASLMSQKHYHLLMSHNLRLPLFCKSNRIMIMFMLYEICNKENSVAWVRERPPLVGKVNANFCG
jgi:hypothetical protein